MSKSFLKRLPRNFFSFAIFSTLLIVSSTVATVAKPIKIGTATTFDFKGCFKSSDGNDIICTGTFRNRDADKRVDIMRTINNETFITDYSGKNYIPDELAVSNGKSCRTGCSQLSLNLVEGVEYKVDFIFKDVSLSSPEIALLKIKMSYADDIKIRRISVGVERASSEERNTNNENIRIAPRNQTQSPEQMIKTYFATVLNRDYKKAWSMVSSNAQSDTSVHPNGYNSFVDQCKRTGKFDLKLVELVSQNNQEAIVNVDINHRSRIRRFQYTLKKDVESGNWMIFKGKYS
jgi:hypothetical protein